MTGEFLIWGHSDSELAKRLLSMLSDPITVVKPFGIGTSSFGGGQRAGAPEPFGPGSRDGAVRAGGTMGEPRRAGGTSGELRPPGLRRPGLVQASPTCAPLRV